MLNIALTIFQTYCQDSWVFSCEGHELFKFPVSISETEGTAGELLLYVAGLVYLHA